MMDDVGSAPGVAARADADRLVEELREAVRARDEFVAIAAHELRNPMTPLLMQVGLLLLAVRNPERCRPDILVPRVELLELAVQDFLRRASSLLDVSRINSGNLRVEREAVALDAVVGRVLDRVAPAAQRARSELQTAIAAPVTVLADPLAAEQVVENLLSNAIKFGAGRPVGVSLGRSGPVAALAISDQGIGISAEDQARIFERFERAVTQREHGGFGIGLWLANRLVRAMDGEIAVSSEPGRGTTFIVSLPLCPPRDGRGPGGDTDGMGEPP